MRGEPRLHLVLHRVLYDLELGRGGPDGVGGRALVHAEVAAPDLAQLHDGQAEQVHGAPAGA